MPNLRNRIFLPVLGALVLFGLGPTTLHAGAREDAAAAYAGGDFSAAVRAYETALAAGTPDAALYYNLALAQEKAGQKPEATLSLRRAILLDPTGIEARMALSDLERSQGLPRQTTDWRDFVAERFSLPTLIVLGSVSFWVGAFLLLFVIFRSRQKFWPGVWVAVLLVLGTVLAGAGFLSDPRYMQGHDAIVLPAEGQKLLAAPADQSETLASLPAGSTLSILRKSGEWVYGRTVDGKTGWVQAKGLALVVPES